jgi:hypothetical protein
VKKPSDRWQLPSADLTDHAYSSAACADIAISANETRPVSGVSRPGKQASDITDFFLPRNFRSKQQILAHNDYLENIQT